MAKRTPAKTGNVQNPPAAEAPQILTRSQAYQMAKEIAARKYADQRATSTLRIEEFESHYGSTSRVDASLVNEMRALMMRCAAIAQATGKKKSGYGETERVPNAAIEKVAKSLAGAVGEIEFYLATNKARSLFDTPNAEAYVGRPLSTSQLEYMSPERWVGTEAEDDVKRALAAYTIVPDEPITGKGMKDNSTPVMAACSHAVCEPDHYQELGVGPEKTCVACEEKIVTVTVGDEMVELTFPVVEVMVDLFDGDDPHAFRGTREQFDAVIAASKESDAAFESAVDALIEDLEAAAA